MSQNVEPAYDQEPAVHWFLPQIRIKFFVVESRLQGYFSKIQRLTSFDLIKRKA